MGNLIIQNMFVEGAEGFFKKRISFKLRYPRTADLSSDSLVFEYSVTDIEPIGDSAVFSLLPVAYWGLLDIQVSAEIPISDSIQERINKICDVWNRWYDYKRGINVFGGQRIALDRNKSLKSGLLFSAGVDSMASYLDKEGEIEYLLFCFGADIFSWEKFKGIERKIQEISNTLKKKLIFYSTNIRRISDISWGRRLHGCALISPLLVLSPDINKVIISSTDIYDFAKRHPWGSSPLTDPCISNNRMFVEHYGCHLRRIDKIRKIIQNQACLRSCRVCYQNSLEYNCGVCEKCLRTMLPLLLLGVPSSQVPFSFENYSLEKFLKYKIRRLTVGEKMLWAEILDDLKSGRFNLNRSDHERVEKKLLEILGSFYDDYRSKMNTPNFNSKFMQISRVRRMERCFGLQPDSLKILNFLENFLRKKYYWLRKKIKKT